VRLIDFVVLAVENNFAAKNAGFSAENWGVWGWALFLGEKMGSKFAEIDRNRRTFDGFWPEIDKN